MMRRAFVTKRARGLSDDQYLHIKVLFHLFKFTNRKAHVNGNNFNVFLLIQKGGVEFSWFGREE